MDNVENTIIIFDTPGNRNFKRNFEMHFMINEKVNFDMRNKECKLFINSIAIVLNIFDQYSHKIWYNSMVIRTRCMSESCYLKLLILLKRNQDNLFLPLSLKINTKNENITIIFFIHFDFNIDFFYLT